MPLETATYINQLVQSNPDGAVDTKNTLDDHIRLIKATLRASFANIGGPVTVTHSEINFLSGVTSAIQTQLNTLTTSDAAKMPLAGGTFTGPPIWATAPSASGHLCNKTYVDGAYSAASTAQSAANNAQTTANNATTAAAAAQTTANAAMPKAGGTFTGHIVLAANGSSSLHPASYQQLQTVSSAASAAQSTANAALPANQALGISQGYAGVTPGRALNTNYTNSGSRPLLVCVAITSLSGPRQSDVTVSSNFAVSIYAPGTSLAGSACFIVPPGAVYAVSGDGSTALVNWTELT